MSKILKIHHEGLQIVCVEAKEEQDLTVGKTYQTLPWKLIPFYVVSGFYEKDYYRIKDDLGKECVCHKSMFEEL